MKRKKRRRNRNSGGNTAIIVLALLLGVAIVLLGVLILTNLKKKNNSTNTVPTTAAVVTTAPTTEQQSTADGETTTGNETTGNGETTSASTVIETTGELPSQSFGKWDLATLDVTTVPYGNNADDQTAAGIPQGVFWYTTKYGMYNVDFISDIGVAYNKGQSTDNRIYLTMDCGFDNEHTGPILDILKEKNVKATFFVTSMFYDARPDLIKRMIDEGHRIGSHTINHYDMTTLSIEKQTEEIMDVVNKLKKDFNYDCRLFRFPTGNFSHETLALVENLGLKSVFWSYAYNDYSATQPEVQPSYEKAVKYLHPGAIYLLHASSSTNRAFLGDWIDAARAKGYEFAGVYPVD